MSVDTAFAFPAESKSPDARGPRRRAALDEAALSAWPQAGVRVLAVDDNPANLMLISAMLQMRGITPVLAADGAEALALACELDFDLVLMDLQMPILDGLGATSQLRRFETTSGRAQVPVVAYTSMSPGARVLTAHGLNGNLTKPCEAEELDACLLRWCPAYRKPSAAPTVAVNDASWHPEPVASSPLNGWLRAAREWFAPAATASSASPGASDRSAASSLSGPSVATVRDRRVR